jgi:hypothetical protein
MDDHHFSCITKLEKKKKRIKAVIEGKKKKKKILKLPPVNN